MAVPDRREAPPAGAGATRTEVKVIGRTGKRSRGRRALGRLALGALVAASLAGCGGDEIPEQAWPQRIAADQPDEPATLVRFAQVGAFRDSAEAARLRDSLEAAGWQALVRRHRIADSLPPWRVAVEPSPGRFAAFITGAALARRGLQVTYATDSAPPTSVVQEILVALAGDRGQIVRTRWALSPDREILVAIEDPANVENEPLPDGLVIASERGSYLVREDSVWDAAIAPDWERLAFGKAYLVTATSREGLTARQWFLIGYYTQIPASIVRRHAFEASRMNEAAGFGQPVLVWLDSVPSSVGRLRSAAHRIDFPGGWRVRWTGDGTRLAVGTKPTTVSDDAPPQLWMSVTIENGLARADLPQNPRDAGVRWTEGPVLDVSIPLDTSYRSFPIPGGVVESRDGWIYVRGDRTGGRTRIVTGGIALAVTRTGRYILALVSDPEAKEHAVPYRLAVIELAG